MLKARLTDNGEGAARKFNVVKEQMVKIASQIDLQRKQREELFQQKKKDLLAMQARTTAAITEEFKTREDAEYRLRKQIQDKAQAVRAEIAREA